MNCARHILLIHSSYRSYWSHREPNGTNKTDRIRDPARRLDDFRRNRSIGVEERAVTLCGSDHEAAAATPFDPAPAIRCSDFDPPGSGRQRDRVAPAPVGHSPEKK